jgi:hypothetical protein
MDHRLSVGALFESVLFAPVLQSAFGNANPLGQYGATLIAQSLAKNDRGFARLVDASLGTAS